MILRKMLKQQYLLWDSTWIGETITGRWSKLHVDDMCMFSCSVDKSVKSEHIGEDHVELKDTDWIVNCGRFAANARLWLVQAFVWAPYLFRTTPLFYCSLFSLLSIIRSLFENTGTYSMDLSVKFNNVMLSCSMKVSLLVLGGSLADLMTAKAQQNLLPDRHQCRFHPWWVSIDIVFEHLIVFCLIHRSHNWKYRNLTQHSEVVPVRLLPQSCL